MRVAIMCDGIIQAVVTDDLGLKFDNTKTVKRASNVEFNDVNQLWEAKLVSTGEIIASGKERDKVIAEEVKIVEDRLIRSLQS